MFLRTITLSTAVPADLASEFASRIYFVSDDITDFELIAEDDEVVAVRLEMSADIPEEKLAEDLERLIELDVLSQRNPTEKTVWESGNPENVRQHIFADMLSRGMAKTVGEGQIALGSPFLELMDALDARLRNLVRDAGGSERRYPTLIGIQTLQRCGYFASFPQFVMFVTRLHTDLNGYREFADHAAQAERLGPELVERFANADYCLPPTMCYHTFHELDGTAVPESGCVISTRGKSFRHEARYHRTLERLWDFTIREVVFLGERTFVQAQRQWFIDRILALIEELDLSGRLVVANDPFFCSARTGERIWSQRLLELKYELRLDIESGRDLAAGSFNLHETFFGDTFGITRPEGDTVHTGCLGIGLERLAYAFVCRHGLDPARWPDSLALPS
ncbi:hypothetical protein ACH4TE_35480 [Streptomyces sioyaensis]|uniref:hypothetical protein n=1 Tax=Streptomyces sioyaensis TaxID=67364 RepID=UPI0037A56F7B